LLESAPVNNKVRHRIWRDADNEKLEELLNWKITDKLKEKLK